MKKVSDNLEQSYQYFKDKHAKADNEEGRNKVSHHSLVIGHQTHYPEFRLNIHIYID